jgi:hypothetical protein
VGVPLSPEARRRQRQQQGGRGTGLAGGRGTRYEAKEQPVLRDIIDYKRQMAAPKIDEVSSPNEHLREVSPFREVLNNILSPILQPGCSLS